MTKNTERSEGDEPWPSVARAIAEFVDGLADGGAKERTIGVTHSVLKRFAEHAGVYSMEELTTAHFEAFCDAPSLQQRSALNRARILKLFARHAYEQGWTEMDLGIGLTTLVQNTKRKGERGD
jgi:hypothetical protein